jgi:IS30 family transposase
VGAGWLIENTRDSRYDQHTRTGPEAVSMVNQTPEELQRLLDRGDWLTSGQIATLLGRGRTTMWRRLQRPDMRYQLSPGGQKAYHPEDVRRLVAEAREVRGGEPAGPASDA